MPASLVVYAPLVQKIQTLDNSEAAFFFFNISNARFRQVRYKVW